MVRSTATTQGVHAFSSGEAEFYASVKGAVGGLGAVAMLRDLGVRTGNDAGEELLPRSDCKKHEKPMVEVFVDATAGRGVAMRRGAGRIRHIATPTLWLQPFVGANIAKVTKIAGSENTADLGTKHLDQKSALRHLERCGFKFISGSSDLTLKAELNTFENTLEMLD